MNILKNTPSSLESNTGLLVKGVHRRSFLKWAGGTAAATSLILTGCKEDDPVIVAGEVNFGTGDNAVLNYAYALEQLEAAFYQRVIESQFSGITADERSLLTDIRDHEMAHREFFKAALGVNAIGGLEVDFSSIDFSKRESVLNAAKTFEDLGVAAYNGAGRFLTSPDLLAIAGKIVSVEARHAAYIRDLISNGTFADSTVIDANGLEMSKEPSAVLTAAAPFIKTKINAGTLA
ncbi:ferritin-like domain-containing protein [Runella rosea]|jgi:Ferritin-like domain/TAT (twin-arginine translocation) pathway signal sequence|uniref:Ferritin-like domain-containing protein n=1 Tax=Runella rosea TaxID=2259595 RepID=A0A344THF0_9BACT|nr:ferritin-like domain-containing protein [Runella rosea]AXE18071.1 ferritin-like domain-containing protein [Runella rosea]